MVSFQGVVEALFENTTRGDLLLSFGLFAGLFLVLYIFDKSLVYSLKRLTKKTKMTWDDIIVDFLEGIGALFYLFIAFYVASIRLVPIGAFGTILSYLLWIFIFFYAAKGLVSISHHGLERYKKAKKKKGEAVGESMVGVMKVLASLVIWIVAFLMLLSNFGVEITPLIAGLGIGGLAIGLALQSILGDLFSAFAIYFDKPFEEGDFIIIGEDMGVVKHIGIKTTRIQALGGQELILSNSEMTSSRVNNYKKMNTRRVVFIFGVEYGTSNKKLEKIKKIMTEIIKKNKRAKLDRVHFKQFADSSLNFEVVYYIDSNDYNLYMDVQEDINLKLKQALEKEKVDFAFPSRTVYMRKD